MDAVGWADTRVRCLESGGTGIRGNTVHVYISGGMVELERESGVDYLKVTALGAGPGRFRGGAVLAPGVGYSNVYSGS